MEQTADQHNRTAPPEVATIAEAAKDLSKERAGIKAGEGVLAKPVKELRAQLEVIKDGNEPLLTLTHAQELAGLGYAELRKYSTFEVTAAERLKLDGALKRLPALEARNKSLIAELVESNRELSGFFSSIGLFLRGERAMVKRQRNNTVTEIASLTPALTEARKTRDEIRTKEKNLNTERGNYGFIDDTGVRLTAAGEKLVHRLAVNEGSCRDLPVSRFLEAQEHVRNLTSNRVQRIKAMYQDSTFKDWSSRDRDSLSFGLSFYPGSRDEVLARYLGFMASIEERKLPLNGEAAALQQLFFKGGTPAELVGDTSAIFEALVKRGAGATSGTLNSAAMLASAAPGRLGASERIDEREILHQFLKEAPAGGRHSKELVEYIASQLVSLPGSGKERVQRFVAARTALVEAGFNDDANSSIAALPLLQHSGPLTPMAARSFTILSKLDSNHKIRTESLYDPSVRLALLPGPIEGHLQGFDEMKRALFDDGLEGRKNEYGGRAVALLRGVGQDAYAERREEASIEAAERVKSARSESLGYRSAAEDSMLINSALYLHSPCSASNLALYMLFNQTLNSDGIVHPAYPAPSPSAESSPVHPGTPSHVAPAQFNQPHLRIDDGTNAPVNLEAVPHGAGGAHFDPIGIGNDIASALTPHSGFDVTSAHASVSVIDFAPAPMFSYTPAPSGDFTPCYTPSVDSSPSFSVDTSSFG